MTQIYKNKTMTPKQASACCRPIDDLLDPEVFKALADPTRVQLLGCLMKCGRSCSVGEIADCCHVDISVVSRHLKMLEAAGMIEAKKSGRTVFYTARYEEVAAMLRELADAILDCCPDNSSVGKKGNCCEPKH